MTRPWTAVVLIAALAATPVARAENPIETTVSVQVGDGKVIGIRATAPTVACDLQVGEQVLWHGSAGTLGAVLTDRRVLVITPGLKEFTEERFRLSEPSAPAATISSNILLVVTGERLFGYDAKVGGFIEHKHELNDDVVLIGAERDVATVVLGTGAVGYAAGSGAFVEQRFRLQEDFELLDLQTATATVITSQRLLTFGSGGWAAQDRN